MCKSVKACNVTKTHSIVEKGNDYDRAIEINPNSAFIFNNRGSIKCKLKDYEGAINDYDKAILIDPNYSEAYNNRSNNG